jgi:glycosyltransferase involved in cell wall biosynthesis
MTDTLTCAAILPVRGHASLLDECLTALAAQGTALTEIVVVDDSPDGSLGALPGVRIVRSGGVGPYEARNVGARTTHADVLLFLDARSRPRPGWAAALVAQFSDPEVALAGTESRVSGGPSLAEAAAEVQQFNRLRNYLEKPGLLPYLPTCNLAVRHADFRDVGGFSRVRSGGDADLCWRVLSRSGRRLSTVEDVLLDWVPRDRVVDLLEQNYRYGGGTHRLRTSWASQGVPQLVPMPHWRLARRTTKVVLFAAAARVRGDHGRLVELLVESRRLCFDWGVRAAVDRTWREHWRSSLSRRTHLRVAPAGDDRHGATEQPPSHHDQGAGRG